MRRARENEREERTMKETLTQGDLGRIAEIVVRKDEDCSRRSDLSRIHVGTGRIVATDSKIILQIERDDVLPQACDKDANPSILGFFDKPYNNVRLDVPLDPATLKETMEPVIRAMKDEEQKARDELEEEWRRHSAKCPHCGFDVSVKEERFGYSLIGDPSEMELDMKYTHVCLMPENGTRWRAYLNFVQLDRMFYIADLLGDWNEAGFEFMQEPKPECGRVLFRGTGWQMVMLGYAFDIEGVRKVQIGGAE